MVLTTTDLKQIETLLDEKLDEKLTQFKSDLYNKIDPILNEVTTARDERVLIENRLEKLEELHPNGAHTLQS